MDMELIKFYLQTNSVSKAIVPSYRVLQNPKLSEKQAQQMFHIWKEYIKLTDDDEFCNLLSEKSGMTFSEDDQQQKGASG